MIGAAAFIIVIGSVAAVAPDNRIFALRHLVSHGRLNPDAIGTFEWRLGAYHTALDQIRTRPLIEDVFGSGTSSAAQAVVTFNPTAFPADTIDANRAIHNEFLRTFYEWGAIGSLLFLAFWIVLIAGFARTIRSLGIRATQTFWGLLPTLMLGLLLENVLAGSGTPVGTGFALVIAFTAAATASANQRTEPNHAYSARTQLIPSTRW
jgi:O-antigen ligase